MSALDRLSALVARATAWLAAFAVLAMCVHVAAGILTRAILGVSLTGTVEIVSYYWMVIIAFAPWAFAQWTREHIAVDVLATMLPTRARVILQFAANLATLAVICLIAWAMIDMAIRATGLGELVESGTMDIPVWPARWIAVAGVVGMIVVLAAQILRPASAVDPAPRPEGFHDEETGL